MSQTEWLVRVKLPLGLAARIIEPLAIKHSSVSQGPFALRCAKFGGNLLAPSETLP